MQELIGSAIKRFEDDPHTCAKVLREVAGAGPDGFREAAAAVLTTSDLTARGARYLLAVLSTHDLWMDLLTDPALPTQQAASLAKAAAEINPKLDYELSKLLTDERGRAHPAAGRLLDILNGMSPSMYVLPNLLRVIDRGDPKIRSKAAMLASRLRPDAAWLERCLAEDDPRVRANAIEALWNADAERCLPLLWSATKDPHNRVVGNALYALYRSGQTACIPRIIQMASKSAAEFRLTAAWVMGECRDHRFLPTLGKLLTEVDGRIRRRVFHAVAATKHHRDDLLAGPELRIFAHACEPMTVGTRIHLSLFLPGGAPAPAIHPCAFLLACNGEYVHDYEVRALTNDRSVGIGFVIPRGTGSPIAQALAEVLQFKGRSEQWCVMRYSPLDAHATDIWVGHTRFSSSKDVLMAALRDGNNATEAAGSVIPALARLNDALPGTARNRHIVVFEPPEAAFEAAQAVAEIESARRNQIHVHWLRLATPEQTHTVDQLRSAGADVYTCDAIESLTKDILSIWSNTCPHYEIRSRGISGEARVSIQVLSEAGHAAAEVDSCARVQPSVDH